MIPEEEYERLEKEYIKFMAQVRLLGGGAYAVPDEILQAMRGMEERGIKKEDLDIKIQQKMQEIKEEKASKRKNDPEGYERAVQEYENMVRKLVREAYTTYPPKSVIYSSKEQEVVGNLYEYEDTRRDIFSDVQAAKKKVEAEIEEIKKNLSPEEKKFLEDTETLEIQEELAAKYEVLRYDARHKGGGDTFMHDLFEKNRNDARGKAKALEEEQRGAKITISMSDIVCRALGRTIGMDDDDFARAEEAIKGREVKEQAKGK